jgi:hypothetical protein
VSVLSPWQWFCSTRTLSNCLEAFLTAGALYFWPWHWVLEPRPDAASSTRPNHRVGDTVRYHCTSLPWAQRSPYSDEPNLQIKDFVAIGSSRIYPSAHQHSHLGSNIVTKLMESISTSPVVVDFKRHRVRVGGLSLYFASALVFILGTTPLSRLCQSNCEEMQGFST